MLHPLRKLGFHWVLVICAALLAPSIARADNQILGELKFVHNGGGIERLAGVWVDGQYLGYLSELKGSKKVLLVPGEHEVRVRHVGYRDFTERITLEPAQKRVIQVVLQLDPSAPPPPATTSEVRTLVRPNRAAVFVDGTYVGHADEFDGPGQAMILPSGKHSIRVALPGYRDFATEIELFPGQKFELKTELVKGSIRQAGPLITAKYR
jgi:hypothetical protein